MDTGRIGEELYDARDSEGNKLRAGDDVWAPSGDTMKARRIEKIDPERGVLLDQGGWCDPRELSKVVWNEIRNSIDPKTLHGMFLNKDPFKWKLKD